MKWVKTPDEKCECRYSAKAEIIACKMHLDYALNRHLRKMEQSK